MTDDARAADWAEAVAALPRGAAVIVRHREARAREALAQRLRPIARARGVKLLVADDAGLAVRVGADGVHVPERKVAAIAGLRARHPRWIITISAHGLVRNASADAVLLSPVFATASHAGRAGLGVVRFAALSRGRVYALGGVDAASVQRLAASNACGIALIGGWIGPRVKAALFLPS